MQARYPAAQTAGAIETRRPRGSPANTQGRLGSASSAGREMTDLRVHRQTEPVAGDRLCRAPRGWLARTRAGRTRASYCISRAAASGRSPRSRGRGRRRSRETEDSPRARSGRGSSAGPLATARVPTIHEATQPTEKSPHGFSWSGLSPAMTPAGMTTLHDFVAPGPQTSKQDQCWSARNQDRRSSHD